MLSVSAILTLAAGLMYAFLMVIAAGGHIENKLKANFLIYLFCILVVQITLFLVTVSTDIRKVDLYYSINSIAFIAHIGLFFPLVRRMAGVKKNKIGVILSLAVTAAMMGLNCSRFYHPGYYLGRGGFFVPNHGAAVGLLFAPMFVFWIWGVVTLAVSSKRTTSRYTKNKLRYPLLGGIIVLAGGFSNLSILREYPVDVLFYLISASLLAYSILKHRVIDVKIALKKGFVYISLLISLFFLYYFIYWVIDRFFSDRLEPFASGLFALVIILLIVFALTRKIFVPLTKKNILLQDVDFQGVLDEYGRHILALTSPMEIIEALKTALLKSTDLSCFAAFLKNKKSGEFELFLRFCSSDGNYETLTIPLNHSLFRFLRDEGGPVWYEELKAGNPDVALSELFPWFSAEAPPDIIMPLFEHGEITGLVCFSDKNTGKIYGQEDMSYYMILANLASSALQKAHMFEDLEKSLKEKEILLREVHHRVKNNLQMISSLIELQRGESAGREVDDLIEVTQSRIHSIAHVHESIYISESLSTINCREYIESLVADIHSQYGDHRAVSITLRLEDLHLTIGQAVPLGLIINELITNSFKHAFLPGEAGELTIQTALGNGFVECRIRDNGMGFTPGRKPKSLGLTIVEALVTDQLGGEWLLSTAQGTEHIIRFPLTAD